MSYKDTTGCWKKGKIIVVLDTCHSGDAIRGELDEIVRGVDAKSNIPKNPNRPLATPLPEQWLTIISALY